MTFRPNNGERGRRVVNCYGVGSPGGGGLIGAKSQRPEYPPRSVGFVTIESTPISEPSTERAPFTGERAYQMIRSRPTLVYVVTIGSLAVAFVTLLIMRQPHKDYVWIDGERYEVVSKHGDLLTLDRNLPVTVERKVVTEYNGIPWLTCAEKPGKYLNEWNAYVGQHITINDQPCTVVQISSTNKCFILNEDGTRQEPGWPDRNGACFMEDKPK